MSVYDLKTEEAWQEILDTAARRFDMPAALMDENNVILQQSGTRNALCRAIREGRESKPLICGQSQQYMAEVAWKTEKPVIDSCEAGLAKVVLPLFHEGRRAGTLTACGLCGRGEEVEDFLVQKSTGLDDEALSELKSGVRSVDVETLKVRAEDLYSQIREG